MSASGNGFCEWRWNGTFWVKTNSCISGTCSSVPPGANQAEEEEDENFASGSSQLSQLEMDDYLSQLNAQLGTSLGASPGTVVQVPCV
jgi:hypothetical protein